MRCIPYRKGDLLELSAIGCRRMTGIGYVHDKTKDPVLLDYYSVEEIAEYSKDEHLLLLQEPETETNGSEVIYRFTVLDGSSVIYIDFVCEPREFEQLFKVTSGGTR